ncbi:uncharacterized protein LOC111383281 [Olea europaea var. sylvestris]|uniref:uncharacterized protein LOC111383281 n=1 Tax=Olea europaea var. sylvestris TaxID=158386 RepID=UPI000C1D542E|nr:uncharacterized protein LOC111383281 [Olea europaea var. sylvestris]
MGSPVDTSLFTFHHGDVHIFVLIDVDNLLITGSCSTSIQHLVTQLKQEFALKALGELGYFLGVEASRDTQGLHLCQSKYILNILYRFRMVGVKPYPAPYVSGGKLSTIDNEPVEDINGYRQLSAKRVLRYLKGTIDHGLYFYKGSLKLHAYCDSDWVGDPSDRRSTAGYGIFLGPCLISWCAKKQGVVSRSSTESQYRALAMVVAELY